MIMVLGGIVTYGITNFSQNNKVNQGTENSPDNFAYNRAYDLASSMADILLKRISDDATDIGNARATEDFLGRKAAYIVEETFIEDDNLFEIKVTTKSEDVTTIFTTYICPETKRKERINVRYE
ncbi:MAG: hypothetical protein WBG58_17805 [Ignavibacteriaceae bacterium]